MVERFHSKSLTFPLVQLNKAMAQHNTRFELYGEQVGARKLYTLQDVSHGSLTVIPRGTAKEIFYALNALLHTLRAAGTTPPREVHPWIEIDVGVVTQAEENHVN
jgi:hypothetical protein